MFILCAKKNEITVMGEETVTSGSMNVYPVQFEFSSDWDDLERVAVFTAGQETRAVLLDSDNRCTIPWEVLKKPGVHLFGGACGKRDGVILLRTVWANLGYIRSGVVSGEETRPPTPELWEQKLSGKGDNLDLQERTLRLRSGEKVLSTVELPAGGGGTPGPPGRDGVTPSIRVGSVTTLEPGQEATVTRQPDSPDSAPVFDFGIPKGPKGDPGSGLPPGGATGQIPAKASGADYDIEWTDPPEGGGTDITPGDGLSGEGGTLNVDNPVRGIMTQAEFNALTEEQKSRGTYFVDDGANGGGSLEVYDDRERVIGTWFGKPLYRKVFLLTAPSSNVMETVLTLSDYQIDKVCFVRGSVVSSDGSQDWFNSMSRDGVPMRVKIRPGGKEVGVQLEKELQYGQPCTLVFEYTKTTDMEVSA